MTASIYLRNMETNDGLSILSIYDEGIKTGNATFQQVLPSWEEWDQSHIKKLRYVSCIDEQIVGWIAVSPTSSRCVYQGVAEVSLYISEVARGKGMGTLLLEKLIVESEKEGYWTLQAGIFSENIASINLHKKFGFVEVGVRRRIGKLNGVWRDVLLLERRSTKVGLD